MTVPPASHTNRPSTCSWQLVTSSPAPMRLHSDRLVSTPSVVVLRDFFKAGYLPRERLQFVDKSHFHAWRHGVVTGDLLHGPHNCDNSDQFMSVPWRTLRQVHSPGISFVSFLCVIQVFTTTRGAVLAADSTLSCSIIALPQTAQPFISQ